MKKQSLIIAFIITLPLWIGACYRSPVRSVFDYRDNILIIDADNITGDALNKIGEITRDADASSAKRLKFIVISPGEAEKIKTYGDTLKLKEKILSGFYVIYPQADRQKLNDFTKMFFKNLSATETRYNGAILKREINLTAMSCYVQVMPSVGSAETAAEYAKTVITGVVEKEKANSARDVFLGLYMGKAIVDGSDIYPEPFTAATDYDRLDTYLNDNNKMFDYSFDATKQKITYAVSYDIDPADCEFFYLFLVVADFGGKVKALSLSPSAYCHAGVVCTMSKEFSVYSGYLSDDSIEEYVKVTFNYL